MDGGKRVLGGGGEEWIAGLGKRRDGGLSRE